MGPWKERHASKLPYVLCKLSFLFFLFSVALLWSLLGIIRSSQKLPAQHSYEASLLPGFVQLEHQQSRSVVSGLNHSSDHLGAEQQQSHSSLHHKLSDVPGCNGPPFMFPKLIHQVVQDKCNLSCEVKESIHSWIDMNPGYTHVLYDTSDMLAFVKQHYNEWLPIYIGLTSNSERIAVWRYLVLHHLGGVYADSDVKCMQPISTWNEEHSYDAALLVGIVDSNTHTGEATEFNHYVMAAMPGHPVLATMPLAIAADEAYSHLTGLPLKGRELLIDARSLVRTGSSILSSAIKAYVHRTDASWPINSREAHLHGGVLFGSVRAMPEYALGMGWDALRLNMTCEEVKQQLRPEALVCRQFAGTRRNNQARSCASAYRDCKKNHQPISASIVIDADYDYDYL
jgi:hypothetical protein